jgi:hypothetical protein
MWDDSLNGVDEGLIRIARNFKSLSPYSLQFPSKKILKLAGHYGGIFRERFHLDRTVLRIGKRCLRKQGVSLRWGTNQLDRFGIIFHSESMFPHDWTCQPTLQVGSVANTLATADGKAKVAKETGLNAPTYDVRQRLRKRPQGGMLS